MVMELLPFERIYETEMTTVGKEDCVLCSDPAEYERLQDRIGTGLTLPPVEQVDLQNGSVVAYFAGALDHAFHPVINTIQSDGDSLDVLVAKHPGLRPGHAFSSSAVDVVHVDGKYGKLRWRKGDWVGPYYDDILLNYRLEQDQIQTALEGGDLTLREVKQLNLEKGKVHIATVVSVYGTKQANEQARALLSAMQPQSLPR